MVFSPRRISEPSTVWLKGFLRVPGCSRGGVFLGNPKDSVWEDWGTLGNPLPLEPPGTLNNRLKEWPVGSVHNWELQDHWSSGSWHEATGYERRGTVMMVMMAFVFFVLNSVVLFCLLFLVVLMI